MPFHCPGTGRPHSGRSARPDALVQHGAGDLYPPLGVSGHEVGGADVQPGVLPDAEGEDAGMLQVSAHDGKYPDTVGLSGYAGPEAADAADVQYDVHSGLAGLRELVDQVAVGHGVALYKNMGRLARPGLCGLPVDEGYEPVFEAVRGDQQVAVLPSRLEMDMFWKKAAASAPMAGLEVIRHRSVYSLAVFSL